MKATLTSVQKGIRVNVTLCFSQEQAAAVYAATIGAKEPVYVSPFVGRLDDRGDNGMDVVRNIKQMYQRGDGHVHVLAASLRRVEHLLYTFALGAELATVPAKVLEKWAEAGFSQPDRNFRYEALDEKGQALKPIAYKEIDLTKPWDSFDIRHELTSKGIEKFVADYKSTLAHVPYSSYNRLCDGRKRCADTGQAGYRERILAIRQCPLPYRQEDCSRKANIL